MNFIFLMIVLFCAKSEEVDDFQGCKGRVISLVVDLRNRDRCAIDLVSDFLNLETCNKFVDTSKLRGKIENKRSKLNESKREFDHLYTDKTRAQRLLFLYGHQMIDNLWSAIPFTDKLSEEFRYLLTSPPPGQKC